MRNSTSILIALGFSTLAGCLSGTLTTSMCDADTDCPDGATCDPVQHICLGQVAHTTGAATSSSTGTGQSATTTSGFVTSSSGAATGATTTSGNGDGSGNGSATGNGSGISNGSGNGSGAASSTTTTSGSTSSTTTTTTTSSSTTSSSSGSSGASSGTIGPQGGSVASLSFAVVGDTRPQSEGDTSGYPTAIITDIYSDINGLSPEFVIATGDYAFCSDSDCAAQTANYLSAAQEYKVPGTSTQGQIFLGMGNHECNGDTASNCAPDNYMDGVTSPTANYTNFFNMLNTFGINSATQPTLATGNPYYEVDVNSSDSSNPWTAKIVIIAANAWDDGQSTWLTSTMQKQTTYTFVVRHESYEDDGAASSNQPGDQGASDKIIDSYPYTMLLVGHTHEYSQSKSGSGQPELIVGNGGAETSGPAGFVMCNQLSNGNISCQPYSSSSTSNPTTNGSAVVVNAAGAMQ